MVSQTEEIEQHIQLFPAQEDFLLAQEPEVLYSGAFGAGKSRAGCYKLLQHALIPGNLVGLCRKKHTNLRQTTLRTLLKPEGTLPPILAPGTYIHNKTEQLISIHGGGDIYHFGFDEESRIGSLNLGACFVDEGIELDEEEYVMLLGRVRNLADPCRQIFTATNPGSPAHFLFERFLAPKRKRDRGRRVIHTTSLDNWFLPRDYIARLKTLTGTAYRRYVLGEWIAFEGAVYPMFDAQRHVQTLKRKSWDEIILGVDWGFGHPSAIVALARYGKDTAYALSEMYERNLTPDKMRDRILQFCNAYPVYMVACDPSRPDMIAYCQEVGIPATEADNTVEAGIARVQLRLENMTLIFSPETPNLIREMQSYIWKENSIKEQPKKVMDDTVDALRYAIMSWDQFFSTQAAQGEGEYEPDEDGDF